MLQGKPLIIALVAAIVGFSAGFFLRAFIAPRGAPTPVGALMAAPKLVEPRGTQYFAAHLDEARQVQSDCRDGSARGGECVSAEEAVIKVEAQERRKRFLGN